MSTDRRRPLALDDLTRIQNVSDPRISPDGERIAFVVETLDAEANEVRSRVWIVNADGDAKPRPLTDGTKQDVEPRWSPDGQSLAFVSNRTGTRQIWLVAPGGGEPRQLTDHPIGAHGPVWSPDGQRLAFLAKGPDRRGEPVVPDEKDERKRLVRVRDHRHKLDGAGFFGAMRDHVWIVPVTGGTAEQVTDGPYEDESPAWSPDGTKIAFVSDRSSNRDVRFGGGAVHVVDVGTREVSRLTSETGRAAHPSWSPGGRWIAYVGSDQPDEAGPSHARLWIVNVDGKGARCLTADLDRSVGQRPGGYLTPSAPAWTREGAVFFYLIGDGPSTHLYRISEIGRTSLTTGRLVVQSFTVDRAARLAALLITDPTTPPEVWVCDYLDAVEPIADQPIHARLASALSARDAGRSPSGDTGLRSPQSATPAPGSNLRQITAVNRALLDEIALARPEDVNVVRPDGTTIEGWLLRPTAWLGGKVPLILSIHGGPHNYFGDAFSFDLQLYASRGYAVLYGNPRGSGGYGEAFARAVCEDWAGEDYNDLMALLDRAIEHESPSIDVRRLGITGSSYGGYMTCWAIGHTDRFAAAVSGACISNLISFVGTSDIGASWAVRELGGTPFERRDWLLERSPLTHAERVKTPLLLYHGEADLRCPIEQSEQMFTALRRLGKTVEFLRVPGESHAVLNGSPSHRLAARQAILDWFERYLRT